MQARQRFSSSSAPPSTDESLQDAFIQEKRREKWSKLPLIVLIGFLICSSSFAFYLILRNAKIQMPNTPKHTFPTSDGLSECHALTRDELQYPEDNLLSRSNFYKPFLFRTEVKFAHWETYRLPWAENGTVFEEPRIHVFSPSIIQRNASEYLVLGRHTPINLCNWTWGPWHHQHVDVIRNKLAVMILEAPCLKAKPRSRKIIKYASKLQPQISGVMSIFGEPKPIFGIEDVRPVDIGGRLWGFGAYGYGAEKDWIVRWGALVLDTAEGALREELAESVFFTVIIEGDTNRIQKNMLPLIKEVGGKVSVLLPWTLTPILDILKCDIEDENTAAIYSWTDIENIIALKRGGNKIHIHCRSHQSLELAAFGVPLIQMRLTTHGGSQHVFLPEQNIYVGLAHFMRKKRSYTTMWYSMMLGSKMKVLKLKFSPEFCIRRQTDGKGGKIPQNEDVCERIQVVRGLTIDETRKFFIVTYTVMDCDSRVAMIPVVNVLDSLILIETNAREL